MCIVVLLNEKNLMYFTYVRSNNNRILPNFSNSYGFQKLIRSFFKLCKFQDRSQRILIDAVPRQVTKNINRCSKFRIVDKI